MVNLKGLTELRSLGLIKAQISDAGLMRIKDLPKLDSLNLHGTRIVAVQSVRAVKRPEVASVGFLRWEFAAACGEITSVVSGSVA